MPGKPFISEKLTGLGVLTLVILCWSSTADLIFLKSSPLLPWSFWIPWKRSLYCEVGNFLVEKTLPCLHPYQWLELELEVVFQSACCRFASWAVHQFAPRTSGSHSTLHLLHNTTPFMMDAFGLLGSELDEPVVEKSTFFFLWLFFSWPVDFHHHVDLSEWFSVNLQRLVFSLSWNFALIKPCLEKWAEHNLLCDACPFCAICKTSSPSA